MYNLHILLLIACGVCGVHEQSAWRCDAQRLLAAAERSCTAKARQLAGLAESSRLLVEVPGLSSDVAQDTTVLDAFRYVKPRSVYAVLHPVKLVAAPQLRSP